MTMITSRAAGLVVLLAALATSAGAAPDEASSKVASQIAKLEQQVNAAYAANDLPAYFAFYADDLRALFPPEPPTTLPAYKANWGAFVKSGGGIVSFKYSDLHIQVSPRGDAAVASYQAVTSTKTPGKGVSAESFDETDVWFKRGGVWKIVEVHYSDNTPAK